MVGGHLQQVDMPCESRLLRANRPQHIRHESTINCFILAMSSAPTLAWSVQSHDASHHHVTCLQLLVCTDPGDALDAPEPVGWPNQTIPPSSQAGSVHNTTAAQLIGARTCWRATYDYILPTIYVYIYIYACIYNYIYVYMHI